jgi:hypothetical protein
MHELIASLEKTVGVELSQQSNVHLPSNAAARRAASAVIILDRIRHGDLKAMEDLRIEDGEKSIEGVE